ncbi:MAG: hypothetical protein AAF899_17660 [Pseudomonadota bacterium]
MTILAKSIAALALIATGSVADAAEHRIDAFAPLVVVGEHKVVDENGIAKIAGTLQGPLYVEADGRQTEDGIRLLQLRADRQQRHAR